MKNEQEQPTTEGGSKKTRGPAVPTLNLEKSIGLLKKVWEMERRNAAPVPAILTHWGYKPKSSGGFLAIASLKRFGLLDEQGSNERRTLRLSQLALDLLRNESTDAVEYQRLLKSAALNPRFHRQLWIKYGAERPSDPTVENHLVFDLHFSEDSARAFLKEYKETIAFAKLADGDTALELDGDDEQEIELPAVEKPTVMTTVTPLAGQHLKQPPKQQQVDPVKPGELSVPIADGLIARVPFPMTEDDFDLLIGTLQLWKKKLVRPMSVRQFPMQALWKNKDFDKPVTIVGMLGEHNGEQFYQSQDGTGIPSSELFFNA